MNSELLEQLDRRAALTFLQLMDPKHEVTVEKAASMLRAADVWLTFREQQRVNDVMAWQLIGGRPHEQLDD